MLRCCRLNGIFGNTDLMFYNLDVIDKLIQHNKESISSSLAASSVGSSALGTSPRSGVPASTTLPSQKQRGLSVDLQLSLPAELDKMSGDDALVFLIEQVVESAKTIQKCADHQKRMTDDVLQLSRLRANTLTITNTPYQPYDTVMNVMTIFKSEVEAKVLPIPSSFCFVFSCFASFVYIHLSSLLMFPPYSTSISSAVSMIA